MRLEYPSQKILKELFNYRSDGNLIRIRSVGSSKNGNIAGYQNTPNGYLRVTINDIGYLVHILIWTWHYGYVPENDIDHRDRIKYHNWISNLRDSTRSCNMRNVGLRKDNTSGVKGVYWSAQRKKWIAQIGTIKKVKNIGGFNDFSEAVLYRFSAEQCLDWKGCDSSSPAYQYCIKHKLIKREV